jgi:hypothetical protein
MGASTGASVAPRDSESRRGWAVAAGKVIPEDAHMSKNAIDGGERNKWTT